MTKLPAFQLIRLACVQCAGPLVGHLSLSESGHAYCGACADAIIENAQAAARRQMVANAARRFERLGDRLNATSLAPEAIHALLAYALHALSAAPRIHDGAAKALSRLSEVGKSLVLEHERKALAEAEALMREAAGEAECLIMPQPAPDGLGEAMGQAAFDATVEEAARTASFSPFAG